MSDKYLERDEYIWAVNGVSPDDGHNVTLAYFSNRDDADKYARERQSYKAIAVQTTLYKSGGRYYLVRMEEVQVDELIHYQNALAKLTEQERRALGVG